jgi:hypothetical protein
MVEITEVTTRPEDAGRMAALDSALAGALHPPTTPPELRAGVLAAIARERPIDIQASRRELEQQYRAAIAQLNRYYARRCRDALLLGAGLLAVVDTSIAPLSQRLVPYFADAAPMVAGCLVLAAGALCGAALIRELFRPVVARDFT